MKAAYAIDVKFPDFKESKLLRADSERGWLVITFTSALEAEEYTETHVAKGSEWQVIQTPVELSEDECLIHGQEFS